MFVILQTLLTGCCTFSTLHQRFICIHLLYSYLIISWIIFSITLNTLALYQSTLWGFDALPCRTTSVGRFHHLIDSCITIFSRSLLSAHIRIVAVLRPQTFQFRPYFIIVTVLCFGRISAIIFIRC